MFCIKNNLDNQFFWLPNTYLKKQLSVYNFHCMNIYTIARNIPEKSCLIPVRVVLLRYNRCWKIITCICMYNVHLIFFLYLYYLTINFLKILLQVCDFFALNIFVNFYFLSVTIQFEKYLLRICICSQFIFKKVKKKMKYFGSPFV